MEKNKNKVVVFIAGGGGVGKSTLAKAITSKENNWVEAISYTTRNRRKGEPSDYYNFVNERTFKDKVKSGEIITFIKLYNQAYYGTPNLHDFKERYIIHIISSEKMEDLKKLYPEAISIWVDALEVKENEKRMISRGDAKKDIVKRMSIINTERKIALEQGAKVVINDNLNKCINDIKKLVQRKEIINRENFILFLTGAGGVGKSVIAGKLVNGKKDWIKCTNVTTREKRNGEEENAYNFVSKIEFEKILQKDQLVEYVYLNNNYYGTPDLNKYNKEVVVHIITSSKIREFQEMYPNSISIWVDAPSRAENKKRMVDRGDSKTEIEKRLKTIKTERECAKQANSFFVMNDKLEQCVGDIEKQVRLKMRK